MIRVNFCFCRVVVVFASCFGVFLGVDRIEINATNFRGVGGVVIFDGQVRIKRHDDELSSNTVKVSVDSNRKPVSYEAVGSVIFKITTPDGRVLKGRSDKLVYDVTNHEYRLLDDAFVEEVGKPNVVKGELIIIDRNGDYADVKGGELAPAHIVFEVDDSAPKSSGSLSGHIK